MEGRSVPHTLTQCSRFRRPCSGMARSRWRRCLTASPSRSIPAVVLRTNSGAPFPIGVAARTPSSLVTRCTSAAPTSRTSASAFHAGQDSQTTDARSELTFTIAAPLKSYPPRSPRIFSFRGFRKHPGHHRPRCGQQLGLTESLHLRMEPRLGSGGPRKAIPCASRARRRHPPRQRRIGSHGGFV